MIGTIASLDFSEVVTEGENERKNLVHPYEIIKM